MVFFGTKASRIKDGRISNVTCPSCETQTYMTYSIFGKYAHVYWIPTFPTGKQNVLECGHCKRTYLLKDLPEQIKNKFNLEKQDTGFPIWYFSGLAIIAGIIAIAYYFSIQHDTDVEAFIKDPQVGDIYTIEGERSGYHSTMRITNVSNDSIFALVSDYEYNTTKLSDLNKDSNYSNETISLSKEDIISLFNDELIEDINRD